MGGSEILQIRYPKIDQQIYNVIKRVKPKKIKISKEKNMIGRSLYSPINMNEQFQESFRRRGF